MRISAFKKTGKNKKKKTKKRIIPSPKKIRQSRGQMSSFQDLIPAVGL